jgi:uncharacterized protein YjbJ (UPF0337 family)
MMDWNRIEGNWKQLKGKLKEHWGCLTDDDLDIINGRREQLEGKIQERYGFTKDAARNEIDVWMARPDRAIEFAKRASLPLKIAAKVDAADLTYFKIKIEPLLDHSLIEFIGEIGETQKTSFLANARPLLFPINWPEPFGLVMIEAMSTGTPVIAWSNRSVPEVITDGVSGRIVNSIEWKLCSRPAKWTGVRFALSSNGVSPPRGWWPISWPTGGF